MLIAFETQSHNNSTIHDIFVIERFFDLLQRKANSLLGGLHRFALLRHCKPSQNQRLFFLLHDNHSNRQHTSTKQHQSQFDVCTTINAMLFDVLTIQTRQEME
jgi:hypothetical protein